MGWTEIGGRELQTRTSESPGAEGGWEQLLLTDLGQSLANTLALGLALQREAIPGSRLPTLGQCAPVSMAVTMQLVPTLILSFHTPLNHSRAWNAI